MSATPPVTPAPPLVVGLPIYVTPEPTILKVEDAAGRPLAVTLVHDVRDVLEEAGFKLAPSSEAAGGIVATIIIQKLSTIHADVFIHGAEACGVRLDITRGDSLLATAQPEVDCLSTSAYYGMLPRDAAVAMVNHAAHGAALIAVAETIRPPPPPPPPSPPHEPDPQPELPHPTMPPR